MPMRQREKIQKMLRTIMNGPLERLSNGLFLPALSGIMMFLSFPPADISILAWFSLVPLLLALRSGSLKEAFLRSALAGFVFFTCHLYWLTNVTILGTAAAVVILLMYFACFGILAHITIKYSIDLFVIPFAWVILEYIRGNFLTGFSWGLLGYSQYQNINLIQIADFAGAYGVSFVVAAFNSAVFGLFIKSRKKIAYMMVVLIFILCAVMYGVYRIDNRVTWASVKVSVVQGNIPQDEKWDDKFAGDILDKYVMLTEKAAKDSPDMIAWPETSYPYLVVRKEDEAAEIKDLFASIGIPILVGTVYKEGERYYNSAILFDGNKDIGAVYRKTHLVPFGEYLPFEEQLSFFRKYIDKPIGDLGRGTEYTLFPLKVVRIGGEGDKRTRDTYFLKFGTLICFEDVFPYITRQFAARGANFMVNITNDAWFGETGASRQHLQASVFRAVENRIAVVRAANTGISCFVQPDGRIMDTVQDANGKDIFVEGVQTAEVEIWGRRAYYTFYGDLFVYFCAAMMILILVAEKSWMIADARRQAAVK